MTDLFLCKGRAEGDTHPSVFPHSWQPKMEKGNHFSRRASEMQIKGHLRLDTDFNQHAGPYLAPYPVPHLSLIKNGNPASTHPSPDCQGCLGSSGWLCGVPCLPPCSTHPPNFKNNTGASDFQPLTPALLGNRHSLSVFSVRNIRPS